MYPVTGMNVNLDQIPIDLGIDGSRAAGVDGGETFVVLRGRRGRSGLRLHGHGLWRRLLRRGRFGAGSECQNRKGNAALDPDRKLQNRTLMHGLVYSSCSASDPNWMRSKILQG